MRRNSSPRSAPRTRRGTSTRSFVDALKALQDRLGELNDLVVGPEVLARLGIDAKLPEAGARERLLERPR